LLAALWEGMLAPIISDPAFYAVAIPAVIFLGLAKGGFSGVATGATPFLRFISPHWRPLHCFFPSYFART